MKGAIISIAIGFIVYFLVIRNFLIAKDKNGHSEYINPWPENIDLEENIYRPILSNILPNMGGFLARNIGSLVERIAYIEIGIFKTVDNLYTRHHSIHDEEEQTSKLTRLLEGLMPNTMASSLIQFTFALLVILLLVLAI